MRCNKIYPVFQQPKHKILIRITLYVTLSRSCMKSQQQYSNLWANWIFRIIPIVQDTSYALFASIILTTIFRIDLASIKNLRRWFSCAVNCPEHSTSSLHLRHVLILFVLLIICLFISKTCDFNKTPLLNYAPQVFSAHYFMCL